jgi:hypothetical protein
MLFIFQNLFYLNNDNGYAINYMALVATHHNLATVKIRHKYALTHTFASESLISAQMKGQKVELWLKPIRHWLIVEDSMDRYKP